MMALLLAAALAAQDTVVVGSKMDLEGQVLAELFAQTIESEGEVRVERRFALGGTGIVLAALESGAIDLYPEYSGNLAHLLLKEPALAHVEEIRRRVEALGYAVGPALGFNNTYALGLQRARATALGLTRISDLAAHPELRAGFTPEFTVGDYGWPRVAQMYGLKLASVAPLDHTIAYAALVEGSIALTDVYTTDAAIAQLDLVVLEDDRGAFDRYEGLALAKETFPRRHPRSWQALGKLRASLTDARMAALNTRAELQHEPLETIARDFLAQVPGITLAPPQARGASRLDDVTSSLGRLTLEHARLVLFALLLALAIGAPLGLLAARKPALGQVVVSLTGLAQTIPTIALLCFLIPLFGVGTGAALVALVLYGLLPIVRGVVTGLSSVDKRLLEVATVLGMTPAQRLWRVELPLASVAILNGIQISAVTSVGTATLAALIGGGGYGSLIVSGLALNDMHIVLAGALPSAAMALGVHFALEGVARLVVPRGLRLPT